MNGWSALAHRSSQAMGMTFQFIDSIEARDSPAKDVPVAVGAVRERSKRLGEARTSRIAREGAQP